MNLDWQKMNGLIPAIVQHADSGQVLMLGYMNEEALQVTQDTKKVTFFSRSKNKLWTKGETSKNYLNLISVSQDCDNDALLIEALPEGPTCHTGEFTCFGPKKQFGFLQQLDQIIESRKQSEEDSSYTKSLFNKGLGKISQKVGEEAVETVVASLNEPKDRVVNESADLIFHLMVLLRAQNLKLDDVVECLKQRHNK
ncbi:MAG: bifunctional phosphoribosyl-AMP cyclohydrolase/phosphoribosyl-ATP diphosphatase HisIE [Bdellovibrionales bacterium]|nr:bifunctional phosphoribosyl-AMP cyclohydrolase/phosphoribosyl-ATP diphosphatase HisIE [Bdellovibrionales bacterium]